jgi:hypothetical protein
MCYVTATRILFVKTGIFCQANLFDYSVVEFTTSVCLKSKRRVVDIVLGDTDAVFQSRPHKIHPTRLVTFLQTLRITRTYAQPYHRHDNDSTYVLSSRISVQHYLQLKH